MSEELMTLLRELAHADIDCSDHFRRYPREPGKDDPWLSASDPAGARADWVRCCCRRDVAVHAVCMYARKLSTEVL